MGDHEIGDKSGGLYCLFGVDILSRERLGRIQSPVIGACECL